MEFLPQFDEDLTDLFWCNYKLLQKKQGFRFSVPSILLAHFATLENEDTILELGIGSGVISTLLYARNQTLSCTGVEIQPAQADLARRNMANNHIPAKILCQDFRTLPKPMVPYDCVISNPPYFPIGSGKLNPTDEKALARHELNGTLEDMFSSSVSFLRTGGRLAFVHIPSRLDEIFLYCQKYHFYPYRLQFVHHQKNQNAQFILFEAYKGKKRPFVILPPFFIYNETAYTKEFEQLLGGTSQ